MEAAGLSQVASEWRQQAGAVDLARPLAIVLPAVEHLSASDYSVPELPGTTEVPNTGNGKAPALSEPAAATKTTSRQSSRKNRRS